MQICATTLENWLEGSTETTYEPYDPVIPFFIYAQYIDQKMYKNSSKLETIQMDKLSYIHAMKYT